MQILDSIKQLFGKSKQTVKLTDQKSDDPALFALLGRDYRFGTQSKDFLVKAYGLNPYVFMVIDRICQRLVQINKKLIDSNGKEIKNPEFEDFFDNLNSREDGLSVLYRAAATYLATGECFIVRFQELGEQDQYFVPVNYNVTINEDTKGNVLDYWVTMFGNSETYLKSEVVHISKPDITYDTNHGFSTLRATRKVWESNNEVWSSEASLHKNKGITGVLYSDGNIPLTDTERKKLQEKYDAEHTGTNNFGKVKVSTSKLGYIQMGMNPNDLKSIETRLEHLRTICASFNVDSKLFGDSAASTYNNMAEAQRAMIVNAVIPLSKIILPKMINFIGKSLFVNYEMVLDENSISELQLTKDQQSARIGREVMQGILSPKQGREILYPQLLTSEEGAPVNHVQTIDTISIDEILKLQEAMANGTLSRENAIAMLEALYGFDQQTANNILGNENEG